MPSAKEQIAKILQDQPDDSSYDEILRELAFARMIERGLADSDARRTISHEEMGRRIKTTKPRAGWAESARRMRARDEDRLIDSPGTNPFL
ncbi:MAG: hypothetical protein JJE16_15710 [Nitrospiraceae bacterium]|nr:hypothetical protein [Nitrospiraceae bacterium]